MTLLGAIFDCDGLLADTETPDYHAWREIYEEQGLHFPVEQWAQNIGAAQGQLLHDWHGPLAEHLGPSYDRAAIQARRAAFYQNAIGKLTPLPGVLALLDALDQAGIPCAVASNAQREWVDRVLEITGLTERFRTIATVDEVEHPKPAPDVYLLAASRLGIPPEHCAAFEDSPTRPRRRSRRRDVHCCHSLCPDQAFRLGASPSHRRNYGTSGAGRPAASGRT